MSDSLLEFFHMGGYASFVWPAYGVTAIAIVANIWLARRSLADSLAAARRQRSMQSGSQ